LAQVMSLIKCSTPGCVTTICVQSKTRNASLKNAGWRVPHAERTHTPPAYCPDCCNRVTQRTPKMQEALALLTKARREGKVIPDNFEVWRLPDGMKECAYKPCALCRGRSRYPYWVTRFGPYDFVRDAYNVYSLIGSFCEQCAGKIGIIGVAKPVEGDDCPMKFSASKRSQGPHMREESWRGNPQPCRS